MLIKFNLIKEYVENLWLGPELRLLHRAFSIGHHENNKSFTFFGGGGGRGREGEREKDGVGVMRFHHWQQKPLDNIFPLNFCNKKRHIPRVRKFCSGSARSLIFRTLICIQRAFLSFLTTQA
jgi:hypothetical protein